MKMTLQSNKRTRDFADLKVGDTFVMDKDGSGLFMKVRLDDGKVDAIVLVPFDQGSAVDAGRVGCFLDGTDVVPVHVEAICKEYST